MICMYKVRDRADHHDRRPLGGRVSILHGRDKGQHLYIRTQFIMNPVSEAVYIAYEYMLFRSSYDPELKI